MSVLAARERTSTTRIVAALAELDARKLYLGAGCSSLFTYCTQVLHLSEHAAYGRITAARAGRRFPVIFDRLADGSVHLTTISLLAPLLTADNHLTLLDASRHKSRREVEELVAALRPQPAVAATIRKLPLARRVETSVQPGGNDARALAPVACDPATAGLADPTVAVVAAPLALPPIRSVVVPLAPERYKVQFTASRETYDKLRRAQDLLRHAIPNGDPAAIFDRALTLLIAEVEKSRLAAVNHPRDARPATSGSRHVPAAVKRAVWVRDAGQCAFVGSAGRCREAGCLEFHHVVPFAAGGATDAGNLELRCRAHNAYEAEQFFGPLLARETAPPYLAVP